MRNCACPAGAALVIALALASLAGCGGSESGAPDRLLDGSHPTLPAPLRGLAGSPVGTKVSIAAARALDAGVAACGIVRSGSGRAAIHRIGVRAESVTLRVGRDVRACDHDRSAVAEVGGRWCGISAARLRGERLRDPRLDLCADSKGRLVAAFAWIQPLPATSFVVVDQQGYSEVYRVAGRLPMRISTATGIDADSSSAVFEYAEYSATGRRLARRTLRAYVAG
jgi:hypothetical protein